jgi:hypothetical protein
VPLICKVALASKVQDVNEQASTSRYPKVRQGQQLEHYADILQVDGYAVYKALAKSKSMVLASCLAYARRKFVELHKKTGPRLPSTLSLRCRFLPRRS